MLGSIVKQGFLILNTKPVFTAPITCDIRRTKMDAGEEARSRQYKGTAMSDDEASKVCKIAAFGIYDKSYRNEKSSLVMM